MENESHAGARRRSAAAAVRDVLRDDEELLWVAGPSRDEAAEDAPTAAWPPSPETTLAVALAVVAAGVALFLWSASSPLATPGGSREVAPAGLALFGLIVVGAGFVFQRLERTAEANRSYAVTTRRVLIVETGWTARVLDHPLESIVRVNVVERSLFGAGVWFQLWTGRWVRLPIADDATAFGEKFVAARRAIDRENELRRSRPERSARRPDAASTALRRLAHASGGPGDWPTPPEAARPSPRHEPLGLGLAKRPTESGGRETPDAALSALRRLTRATRGEREAPDAS